MYSHLTVRSTAQKLRRKQLFSLPLIPMNSPSLASLGPSVHFTATQPQPCVMMKPPSPADLSWSPMANLCACPQAANPPSGVHPVTLFPNWLPVTSLGEHPARHSPHKHGHDFSLTFLLPLLSPHRPQQLLPLMGALFFHLQGLHLSVPPPWSTLHPSLTVSVNAYLPLHESFLGCPES